MAESSTANVQVAVRVRPFNRREERMNAKCVIRMQGQNTFLVNPSTLNQSWEDQQKKHFAYDYSYWSFGDDKADASDNDFASQEAIFNDLGSIILNNAFKGFNCSLMAYGQTGAGKSYSMMGGADDEHRGLIPRICSALFERSDMKEDSNITYKVEASYLEIYAERVRDLLNPSTASQPGGLRVREHPETGPYVEKLTVCAVPNYEELETLMIVGNRERTVASTNLNSVSSRSHAVFTITFTQTRFDQMTKMSTDVVSKIQLVDLAGSERVDHSGATGIRLREAANINKSLTTLGRVISALAKLGDNAHANTFIPFRDSVLTWLLKDSLGGNSKTIMMAAISPASVNYEETLSTLRYAARAKRIVNTAVVNEDPNAKIIRALKAEIEELRKQLERQGGGGNDATEEEMEKLREQLAQSKAIIADINKSWEEKLEQTRSMQEQRIKELASQGVATSVDVTVPFLVNLNEDPQLSESILYYLREGATHVGSKRRLDGANMLLAGVGIQARHASFMNESNTVTLLPYKGDPPADTWVNGEKISTNRVLRHGDRIIFGQRHTFRFSNPEVSTTQGHEVLARGSQGSSALSRSRSATYDTSAADDSKRRVTITSPIPTTHSKVFDYDYAQRERTVTRGDLKELIPEEESTAEKSRLIEEKMRALEDEKLQSQQQLQKQREEYSELLAKFNDRQEQMKQESDEEEKLQLRENLLKILPQVEEANAITETLGRNVRFRVQLIAVDKSHEQTSALGVGGDAVVSNPLERFRQQKETLIMVRVTRGDSGAADVRHSLWEMDEFVEKLFLLRDRYNTLMLAPEEAAKFSDEDDPLMSNEVEEQLIGRAHLYLEPLRYGVGIQQRTQIIDQHGDYAGLLTVSVHCTDSKVELSDDDSSGVDVTSQDGYNSDETSVTSTSTLDAVDHDAAFQQRNAGRKAASTQLTREDLAVHSLDHRRVKSAHARVRIRKHHTAGRVQSKNDIPNMLPELNSEAMPFVVRVARADAVPSAGIRGVVIKYRFWNDPHVYTTSAVSIDSSSVAALQKSPSLIGDATDVQIQRRKPPERLSEPLKFRYDMVHRVENVSESFLEYLKRDAITFEVWGTFATGPSSESSLKVPVKTPDARKKPLLRGPSKLGGVNERRQSFKQLVSGNIKAVPEGTMTRSPGKTTASNAQEFKELLDKEHEERSGANLLDTCVDLEELDNQGRYNPCVIRSVSGGEDTIAVPQFHVTAGGEKPKRFVISVLQVDPYDFMLESCATLHIVAVELVDEKTMKVKEKADLPEDGVRLDVWEQVYQIHNKMISITASWPPALTSLTALRRPTGSTQRVRITIALRLYLSRATTPITVFPVVGVKVNDKNTSVSRLRSFFRGSHISAGRLHRLDSYWKVLREGLEDGVESLFHEHSKQVSKLEHNMRIEHIQQHLALVKLLRANNSHFYDEVQRNFDVGSADLVDSIPKTPSFDSDSSAVYKSGAQTITVRRLAHSQLVLRQGYLQKRGKYNTAWKNRWFVLRPPHLFYYRKPTDPEHKGVIDLIGAVVRNDAQSDSPFAFEIISVTRTWDLQASSAEEKEQWIRLILEFK